MSTAISEVHRQIPDFFEKSGILLRDCTSSTTKYAVNWVLAASKMLAIRMRTIIDIKV